MIITPAGFYFDGLKTVVPLLSKLGIDAATHFGEDGHVFVTGPAELTRDMYVARLTISGPEAVLKTNGYRVFVDELLDLTDANISGIHE